MTKWRGLNHGASRYKQGCRCDECRIANTAYEKNRRETRPQRTTPLLKMPYDTLTREEVMRYRYNQ